MSKNNLVLLFKIHEEDKNNGARISDTQYFLDITSGQALESSSTLDFHYNSSAPVMYGPYDYKISYESLLEAAKKHNYTVFQKLQGINETNWKEYIAKFKR